VTSFSFIKCHIYLKFKKNWCEIRLILNQKYLATRKSLEQPLSIINYLGSEETGKNTDGPKIQRIPYGVSGRTLEADGQSLTPKCDPLLAVPVHAAAVCILILLCVCVCVCVCVCECVISMDHGTSCYEVFLPLSLTCCFLQDVSPNTANSNSPLSPSCICSPVLSQIISWCRAPELNRKGVFVVLSYRLTRYINSVFFVNFA